TVATAARDLLRAAEPATPPAPAPTADHPTKAPRPAHTAGGRVPPAAVPQRCLRLIEGHAGWILRKSVYAVAFSPDGRLLATGSDDRTVRLWDPATGDPIGRPFTGHTDWVRAVAFSPDGRLLASGGDDKTVRLWDPATGGPIGRPLTGHTGPVWAVAFSPDGRLLASGSYDKTVRLWGSP
ncbi:MAG TPA: WD40 repeat domain-containing protein, partial [Micromonosporaceae bacterium]